MKNRELLKTGKKPAPGDLALVQGLINTADLEGGIDDLASPAHLKKWLIRHGLLSQSAAVTGKDHRTMIALREGLRRLLAVSQRESIDLKMVRGLNRLISGYRVGVNFDSRGRASLQPMDKGIGAAVGCLLAIVAQATADGTWSYLRICQASTCRWAFYDTSKNHSGRWCSMSVCGSRVKARQYRKRHAPSRNR